MFAVIVALLAIVSCGGDDEIGAPVPVVIDGTVTALEAPTATPTPDPTKPTATPRPPTPEPLADTAPALPTAVAATSVEAPTALPESATPTATPTAEAAPSAAPADPMPRWQVTGVSDHLNVRAGPGTEQPIVGQLLADEGGVNATGDRVMADGLEWMQITLGDDSSFGWVASQFLALQTAAAPDASTADATAAQAPADSDNAATAPETPPAAITLPARACFHAGGTTAALIEVNSEAASFAAVVRIADAAGTRFETVTGPLVDGQLGSATVIDQTSFATRTEPWRLDTAGLTMGSAALPEASCESLSAWMVEMTRWLPNR